MGSQEKTPTGTRTSTHGRSGYDGGMWKASALVLAATGCGFHVGAGVAIDASDDDGGPRDAADAPPDMPPDSFIATSQWMRRKTITIDNTKVAGGPHASFPVLISLPADVDLALDANANGGDIMFIAADGVTRLPYQRQRFVKQTGELIAWVNVPTLSSATPTVIYLYYKNPNTAEQSDVAMTWGPTYRGVWHLDETVGGINAIKDATTNSNHGTDLGGTALNTAGMIGGAATFDGIDDRISMPDSGSLDATAGTGTAAMWVKFTDPSNGRVQLVMTSSNTFGAAPNGFSWSVQADGDHYFYPWTGDTNDYNLVPNPFTNATWAYASVTWAFATKEVKLYVNGALITPNVMNVPTLWTQQAQPAAWLWGGNPADPAPTFFAGQLDELRVSSTVRTAGWIQTEYRNQSSPLTFYSVGVATSL